MRRLPTIVSLLFLFAAMVACTTTGGKGDPQSPAPTVDHGGGGGSGY